MRFARIAFWLLLLPGGLLFLALQMNRAVIDERSGAREERERAQRIQALETAAQQQGEIELAARLEQRRALARRCVDRAVQTIGGDLAVAPATLVVFGYRGCGPDCDTDAIISALADHYLIERLRVLLIRTIEGSPRPTPGGVHAVIMSECAPLVSEHGDDFMFRAANGELTSSGERHEGHWRSGEPPAGFEPEELVRSELRKTFATGQ